MLLEGEGKGRGPVRPQMIEPGQRLFGRRELAHRHPPQDLIGILWPLKPLTPAHHEAGMGRAIDEFEQRLDRLPDRHVDEKIRVGGGEDLGGVATVALEAPDKTGRLLGKRVDAVERRHEIGQMRAVGRRDDAPDIELREMPIRFSHRLSLYVGTPSQDSMPPGPAIC